MAREENAKATLGVRIDLGAESLPEDLSDAALGLRRELLDLDVDAVELARAGEAPPGTRGVDVAALGTLVVTIANTGLLNTVVGAARSWMGSHPRGTIKLELDGDVLEMTGVSSEEQRRLADAWLRRHARR